MTETPKGIWVNPDVEYADREKQYGCNIEYIRADLSADLVRAALEWVAGIADKQRESARSNNCKKEVVGAFWTAKSLRDLASDHEAIAAIVAQVMEKE